jgi:hypothetical protein
VMVDATKLATGSPVAAYASVFGTEAVLFILAAALALRIGKSADAGEASNPLVMAGLHNARN